MRTVIGVMGGAVASAGVRTNARALGRAIAERGWVLLCGGRDAGVMEAVAAGAHDAGGLVVGILPGDTAHGVADGVDIAIPTGMGDARNAINVLASHVVVALPGGPGTVSEVALALKAGRPVILLGFPLGAVFSAQYASGQLRDAESVDATVAQLDALVAEAGAS